MLQKRLKKLQILADLDVSSWGLGVWLHLDGYNNGCYLWAFEIIIGCFWFELLYGEKFDD